MVWREQRENGQLLKGNIGSRNRDFFMESAQVQFYSQVEKYQKTKYTSFSCFSSSK